MHQEIVLQTLIICFFVYRNQFQLALVLARVMCSIQDAVCYNLSFPSILLHVYCNIAYATSSISAHWHEWTVEMLTTFQVGGPPSETSRSFCESFLFNQTPCYNAMPICLTMIKLSHHTVYFQAPSFNFVKFSGWMRETL